MGVASAAAIETYDICCVSDVCRRYNYWHCYRLHYSRRPARYIVSVEPARSEAPWRLVHFNARACLCLCVSELLRTADEPASRVRNSWSTAAAELSVWRGKLRTQRRRRRRPCVEGVIVSRPPPMNLCGKCHYRRSLDCGVGQRHC